MHIGKLIHITTTQKNMENFLFGVLQDFCDDASFFPFPELVLSISDAIKKDDNIVRATRLFFNIFFPFEKWSTSLTA